MGKRVEFLKDAAARPGPQRARSTCAPRDAGRKADLVEAFDVATARAVASLNVLCEFALPLIRVGGCMIAYKGPAWEAELDAGMTAIRTLGGEFAGAHPV